jgi:PAB1-binding protein PBP1
MKIEFDNKKDFIEMLRENDEVIFSISAQDRKDRLKSNVNSASISIEEFKRLLLSSFSKEEIQNIINTI